MLFEHLQASVKVTSTDFKFYKISSFSYKLATPLMILLLFKHGHGHVISESTLIKNKVPQTDISLTIIVMTFVQQKQMLVVP